MPSYQTGGVNIRLAVAELDKTITPNPLTHQNKESLANAERAWKEFTERGTTIAETPLLDDDGCSLGFLGRHRVMPFFMSRVKPPTQPTLQNLLHDVDSQDSPLTELSTPRLSPFRDLDDAPKANRWSRPQNTTPPGTQALCLRIKPTKNTFLRAGDTRRIKWGGSDMKIDIFLNGDLCSSSYIPESAFHKKEPLRDTFSGVRVGWVTEKPWVVLPSSIINDSIGKASASEDVQDRWGQIARALHCAADSYGRNEGNKPSPTSDYLQSLAEYSMPVTLPEMLEAESKRYAIIDVVVVAGKGRKENASAPYLMNPIPLKLEGSRDTSPARASQDIDALEPRKRIRTAHPTRPAADSEILAQGFSLGYVRRGAGTVTPTPDSNTIEVSSANQSTGDAINRASTPIVIPPLLTPLTIPAISTKRKRMEYHDVIDTRQTLEEELKGITDQATNNAKRLVTQTNPAHHLDTPGSPSRIPSPSRILKLKYRSPTAASSSTPSSPDQPLSQLRPLPSHVPIPDLKLDIPSIPLLPAPATSTQPPQVAMKPQGRIKRTRQVYQKPKPFEVSALTKDCVVSYAEGDTVRQVRSERGTYFFIAPFPHYHSTMQLSSAGLAIDTSIDRQQP
ncbi:MAG: hypothetical protein Q9221_001539 [Calogaya cf. arnoldii]